MAPNSSNKGKKKKKAASNPARGFATVSQVSKRAIERESETEAVKQVVEDATAASVGQPEQTTDIKGGSSTLEPEVVVDAPKLSPEEFEKALEESELQQWVDKHGASFRKEVGRQVSRLQTDRRLLRDQAQYLSTRDWLPPDILDEVLELIRSDAEAGKMLPDVESRAKTRFPSEEDISIRLWTLRQTLLDLAFDEESVEKVLRYVLDSKQLQSSREVIWGLTEALDWLALHVSRRELPDYEQRRQQASSVTQELPTVSGSTTPGDPAGTPLRSLSRDRAGGQIGSSAEVEPAVVEDDGPLTDFDSDLEPDELVTTYLRLRARQHLLRNESNGVAPTGKGSRKKRDDDSGTGMPRKTPQASAKDIKIQRALQQIESDVLFDQREADEQWTERRIELEREIAARQKMGLSPGPMMDKDGQTSRESSGGIDKQIERVCPAKKAPSGGTTELSSDEDEDADEENDVDDVGLLGGLFAGLPTNEVDPTTGLSSLVSEARDGSRVVLRDFGKWTGLSPRRVLEEACRSRDAAVRFVYAPVSTSTFAARQKLSIQWSAEPERCVPAIKEAISVEGTGRIMSFTMVGTATADTAQAEAFISTAALFEVFSSSRKEEKVSLRLPHTWRELWGEFAAMKKEQGDAEDREQLRGLRSLVREKLDREAEEGIVLTDGFKKRVTDNANGASAVSGVTPSEQSNIAKPLPNVEFYKSLWRQKCSAPRYQRMLLSRQQLPMWTFKDTVLDAIDQHQVVIICGETGCGKSTQVPSYILERELSQGKDCRIYCTEPRRISAISLARRVSEELGEGPNDVGTAASLVGFAIRLESRLSKETKLVYATTGIVMRMLEGASDLAEITHLVLDEVHERSIDSDFMLIVLRKLMPRRPELRVILMSATVDAQRFSSYLEGAPILQVPGRTFPVQTKYLEDAIEHTGYTLDARSQREVDIDDIDESGRESSQGDRSGTSAKEMQKYSRRTRATLEQIDEYRIEYDLIVRLIETIAKNEQLTRFSKAILVFLPGIAEIRRVNDMLAGHPSFARDWYIYPLHSTIASEEQEQAFLVPPAGMRKIVLATNIAETGITIPDVTCVIDSGKHKEMRFDERRQLSRLIESFISQANAKQRRGRAGRVQEGLCYHLFTRERHDQRMADQQTPEMLRLSLQELALRVKICKLGDIEEILSEALDPPTSKNIRRAVDALVEVKALTSGEDLTPLGRQLAKLPLDVHLGKLVLLGSIFGCLDVAVTMAAILSSKSPFTAPMGSRGQADQIRLGYRRGDSDLLTVWNAYCSWRRVCTTAAGAASEYQFCRKNFLSSQTLSNIEDLKQHLLTSLVEAGFLTLTTEERHALNRGRASKQRQFFILPPVVTRNSDDDLIADSVIAWSFYPKLLVREGKGWRNVTNKQSVSLHPTSVNKGVVARAIKWLSYHHIMQSSNKFLNAQETSAVEEFAIALLCGEADFRMYAGVLIIDGHRIRFKVTDWKVLLVMKVLRAQLREIMARSFRSPGKSLSLQQARWMEVWQRIFKQIQEGREKAVVG